MSFNQTVLDKQKQDFNWQNIIWREWRHCNSKTYARHLYNLVADEPVGWGAMTTIFILSILSGVFIGTLIGFIMSSEWIVLQQFALTGGVIGGLRGIWHGHRTSWRAWLTRLESIIPSDGLGGWFFGGLALGLVGGVVFGPIFWLLLAGFFWVMGGVIKWLNSGLVRATSEYNYRNRWFWWRGRPQTNEVEAALRQACQSQPAAKAIWATPLQRLAKQQTQQQAPDALRNALDSDDWVEHFIAHHTLLALGEDVVAYQRKA